MSALTFLCKEPVNSLEVSKLLSIIPQQSCCLDYFHTAIIKQCSSVLSELIAYVANLSFSQGTFPSMFKRLFYSAPKKAMT